MAIHRSLPVSSPELSPRIRNIRIIVDLVVGCVIIVLLSSALFAGALWITKDRRPGVCDALGSMACAAMLAYIAWIWDEPILARWLPFSNLIVLGNWFLPAAGFLAGIVWRRAPGGLWRKSAYASALIAVGLYAMIKPVWGVPPECGDDWQDGFCFQTSDASCTAACAATLLAAHGIETTEREMAELCLTRNGTSWQGLYRGLKLKTAGTRWDVVMVHGSAGKLRTLRGPAILAVAVPTGTDVDPIYTEQYGWTPGDWHSVLFFGFLGNGRVAMGDPSPGVGREEWTEGDLRVLWRGRGFRLVPR